MRRLVSLAARVALASASIALVLAALEWAMRLRPSPPNFFGELEKYGQTMTYAGHPYPLHLPNFRGTILGVSFRTNGDGLRDRTFAIPKPAGRLRVLALGDSVTVGWGVPEEAMFTKRLEPLLTARRGAPVEVVTGAVGGWNTVEELEFLEAQGFGYEPDVVVLGYVINDNEIRNPITPAARRSLGERLAITLVTNSRLAEYAAVTWKQATAPTVSPPAAPARAPTPAAPTPPVAAATARPEPFTDVDRGWLSSRAALERMAMLTRARGIPFAVFCFDVYGQPIEDRGCAAVEAFLAGRGVPFTSTYHWFDGTDRARFKLSIVDPHPNAEGHAVIATHLADWLAETVPALRAAAPPPA